MPHSDISVTTAAFVYSIYDKTTFGQFSGSKSRPGMHFSYLRGIVGQRNAGIE